MASLEEWCESKGIKIACQGGERKIESTKHLKGDGKGGWDHFAWTCTLSFEGRTFTTPYKCGVAHVWKIGDTYQGAKGQEVKLTKHDAGRRLGKAKAPDAAAVTS